MRRSHLDHTKSSHWAVLIKSVAGLGVGALVAGVTLTAALSPKGRDYSSISVCDQTLGSLTTSLESYKNVGGSYPSQNQGLEALIVEPAEAPLPHRWTQTLDGDRSLLDPWGTKFQYFHPGTQKEEQPEIISAGPDKTFGTDDDQSNQDGL